MHKGGINIIAIYARQSVDKIDSISIETQIDFCKRQLSPDETPLEFFDKGFSGATTNRPQFQKMLSLCRLGKISKIITYKLDRISRSLLQFVLLLEELEKTDTELVSCTESFTSKSEMGVLIMKLLIMFAEMERKNIRSRVRDNYYSRAEKGFYLGGYAPFGYKKIPLTLENKQTSGYGIIKSEEEIIIEIFKSYVYENISANEICKRLNAKGITTRKGNHWTATTLIRLIKNPFYIKADFRAYEFFLKCNATITSLPADFKGESGVVCYGSKTQRNSTKFSSFENEHITVGRHKGIIPSDLWLLAYEKATRTSPSNTTPDSKTFLSSLVVCSLCTKNYTVTSSKGYIYLYCRGRKNNSCNTNVKSLRADYLENIVTALVKKQLADLSNQRKNPIDTDEKKSLYLEITTLNIKLEKLKEQILTCNESDLENLLEISKRLTQKKMAKEDLLKKTFANSTSLCYTKLERISHDFSKLGVYTKKLIAKGIIQKIVISDGKISIFLRVNSGGLK